MRPPQRSLSPTAGLATHRLLRGPRWIGATLVAAILLTVSGPRELAIHEAAASELAAPQALPQLKLPGPSFGLIGGDVELSAAFSSAGAPNDLGYGPFIDLVIDRHGVDGNAAGEMCDGLELVAGSTLLAGASATDVAAFGGGDNCTSKVTVFQHPFVPSSKVTVPLGHQLVSIRLPVGSYAPGAPPLAIKFLSHINEYADDGVPLRIYGRAGFIHGNSPTGTTPILSHGDDVMGDGWESTTVTPLVMLTGKKYLGPEDEAAFGPSHQDDYPLRYEVSVAIAPGQTIDDLVLIDVLPDDMVFDGFVGVKPGCTSTAPTTTPAAGAEVKLECPKAQGIVTMSFDFHMDRLDAGGAPVVNLSTCAATISIDDIKASGMWDPLDPRDKPAKAVSVDVKPDDHKLANKCVAVQKSVVVAVDHGAPGPTPGDLLDYTLSFQVTDFSAFGSIVLDDFLSDGQSFVTTNVPPVLTVSDGSLAAPLEVEWRWADFAPVSIPDRACKAGYPDDGSPFEITGGSFVSFEVSELLEKQTGTGSSTIENGILLGAAVPGGNGMPAWGTIRFRVRIDQSFVLPQPAPPATPGNPSIDKHDPLCNEVLLRAERLSEGEIPGVLTSTGIWAEDDSKAAVQIVPGSLEKKVVGRKGFPDELLPCPNNPGVYCFSPGDTITFEIVKQIPSGDAEDILIEDWFPSPSLDSTKLGAWLSSNQPLPTCNGPLNNPDYPPVDQACWFSTPAQLPTNPPTLPAGGPLPGNGIRVEFGDLGGPGVGQRALHLLVTLAVTDEPYADGLKQVNIARECEANTLGKTYCDVYAAEFIVAAPRLAIRKGVIWTSKPDAVYSTNFGPLKGPISDCTTGFPVSSTSLGGGSGTPGNVPDANILSGLDAGDLVRFAIVVENLGHAVEGAFHVRISDVLPPQLINPVLSCVKDGGGVDLPYKPVGNFFAGGYIELHDPAPGQTSGGSLAPYHPTSGKNLAIVIVQAEIASHHIAAAGCYANRGVLENYAGVEGGEDHVDAGLAWNTHDEASFCIRPNIEKSLSKTSEQHTSDTEDGSKAQPRPVTIGEIVEYEIFVEVPEGQVPGLVVEDALPVDLAYVPGSVVVTAVDANIKGVLPNDTAKPVVTGGPFHCLYGAKPPTFDFGLVTNEATGINNAPRGFRFTFDAQVCNTSNNNHGELKPNVAKVWGGSAPPSTSNAVDVTIVEPSLSLTKTFGQAAPYPPKVGDLVPYEVRLSNDGGLSAYMVRLKDVLPSGLNQVGPPVIDQSPVGCAIGLLPGSALDLLILDMPPDCTVTMTFNAAILDDSCDALINVAHTSWASLPRGVGTRKPTMLLPTFNETGSQVDGASGAPHGARDGSGGVGGDPNDYVRVVETPLCGRVCGSKCEDKNKDGLCDPGEPRLADWIIELSKGGAVVGTTSTAKAPTTSGDPPVGSYCFDVFPGSVSIGENMTQQQIDDEWVQTGPPVPPGTHDFDVGYGDVWQDINFANWKPLRCEGVVRGVKFEDSNGNGVWDKPGEVGLQGWTITATPVGGGASVSTVTDANGEYWLPIKGPGAFFVDEIDQVGWVQTYPAAPRRYRVVVECEQDGTPLPIEVSIEGMPTAVPSHELHFGNRPIAPCSGSTLPGLGRQMYAWGDRPAGKIGGIPALGSPTGVNVDLQAVDQGDFHTVGLTVQGEVVAWGGPPTTPASPAGAPFTAVSAGRGFSVALDSDGAIHTWRDKQFGAQVMAYPLPGCPPNTALSKQYCVTKPTQLNDTFIAIDAGVNAVMAIDVGGHLHTWGYDNSEGQLPGCAIGMGAPGKCVDTSRTYVAASTSGFTSVAIDTIGAIHGWGWNKYDVLPGGCPTGDHYCKKTHPSGSFTAIEYAGTHTLALDDDGAVWAWGDSGIVTPPAPGFDKPFMGTFGTGFTAIAGGTYHSLALRPNGTLEAWGHFWDWGGNTPITPPQGNFYAITGGGIDFSHAAALRCPVKLISGGVIGRVFLPSTWRQAGPIVVKPNPPTPPTVAPTPLPTRRPTWTPAPPPIASATSSASPTRDASPTRPSSATPTATATSTATPRPATPSITPTGSPTPTATLQTLPPPVRGEIRIERGCAEDPAEVLYARGETVPIQVQIFDVPRATVRVIYRWPAGGQERQIDGGPIDAGRVYNVSPPLVLPEEAPAGGRVVSLDVLEPGGSYRTLDICGFTVIEGDDPPTPEPTRTPTPDAPPTSECMPIDQLPGLAAWWRFDEQRGEIALDEIASPTLNHGLIYGQPNRGAGMVGTALQFDGGSTYVEVPDDSSLDFESSPRGDFTLDAWVKLPADAQTDGVHVLMNKQASSGGPGYQLYLWNAQPGLQLADGSGFSNFGSGVTIPKDGQWHLLAVTVDRDRGDGGRFFLDGQPVGSPFDPTVRPGSLANDAVLRIGAPSFSTSSLFDGWLDEVEVLRSVLSAEAVARLERARGAGKCPPRAVPTVPPLREAGTPRRAR